MHSLADPLTNDVKQEALQAWFTVWVIGAISSTNHDFFRLARGLLFLPSERGMRPAITTAFS